MFQNKVAKPSGAAETTPRGWLTFRRILSVAAGLAAIVVLSFATDEVLYRTDVLPRGPLSDYRLHLLELTYRSAYTMVGGYVAAALAPDRPIRRALALGVVALILGVVGAIVGRDLSPFWYSLVIIAGAIPLPWLGGKLFVRRSSGRPPHGQR
jgi:hypothetical protein